MQVLNKQDKEQLVIKLHQDGKTIREIAQQVHMSFTDIGSIIHKIDGKDDDSFERKDLKSKSKDAQAFYLFLNGKRPVDVAIELDLPAIEVENILEEFWVLNQLDELALAYLEIKNNLDLFLRLFHIMKKNKLFNQKDIQTVIKYATDLPSLENKFRQLANVVLDLEIKKKELSAQLLDLGHSINQYQSAIDGKREQLMNMDAYISQLANSQYRSNKPKSANIQK